MAALSSHSSSTSSMEPMSPSKINVLLMEKIHTQAEELFRQEGFTVHRAIKLSEEELIQRLPDIHVIGVRSKTKLPARVLDAATNLMAIGCFCIGTDQTDLDHAADLGIPVFNSPYANTRSVAELVLAEIIMLARQAGDRNIEMHNGTWNKKSIGCYEVRGKTLGIVGYGHVGSQLSVLAESLGMKVLFYDIERQMPMGSAESVGTLKELLALGDFISLHVPANPTTKQMINAEAISNMKPGAYLINASRGSVVDVDATAEALKSGRLAGAAFDVFPVEPSGKTDDFKVKLQDCPNTIMTPHIGGSTEEAQEAIGIEVASKLIDFLNKGPTIDSVNLPEVGVPKLKPGFTRVLSFHQNVPGVIHEVTSLVQDANITFQSLATKGKVGYVVVDLDQAFSTEATEKLQKLKHNIRTRLLFEGPGFRGGDLVTDDE
eukprot:m.166477 g.166477  ORF g.166477 m.166477 type:complete len:433 (+) comp25012_c0_seq2:265-1563(+)